MKKYLRIFRAILRCRVSRQMMYRLNFWVAFSVDISYFAMQLLIFLVIFGQEDMQLGGWTLPHMAIFVGTFTILDAVYMTTYFFGVLQIPELIRSGRLDLYLTKPVNALFLLSFERLDLGSLLVTIPGALMVAWGMRQLAIPFHPLLLLGYLALFFLMYWLMYCVMILIRVPAFWWKQITVMNELEGALVEYAFRVPGVVYRGVWKFLLYVLLPYGLMATIPTEFLTGSMHLKHWLLVGGVAVMFWLLKDFFWKLGLRRYDSASS
ncbi:MAG: ABC-2 family transporter protein [Anaerolineaceae bacterium]|nr:ABC-2 family transporter protein [Anaerolineaceae bacterium]